MDSSYSSLLERTRAPHLSLQKFAVISIFQKLRSSPPLLDSGSDPGRDAITQCLRSSSPAVVDQSVRELCRLVTDSKLDLSHALLELQSALEGCDSRFVDVFVKGIGFLVRYGFQQNSSSFRFPSAEAHPFVKVLSCRREVHSELVQQVLLFMVQNKILGMVEACDFLRPFMYFSIIRIPNSASLSMFVKDLITSMASMCCSFPLEALPLIKFLVGCLKIFNGVEADELRNIHYLVEYVADAYVAVLRNLVKKGLLVHEAQICVVELLETVFSLFPDMHKHSGGVEPVVEVWKRLVCVQKELGLSYVPELSRVTLSLFITLIQSEFEHQQLSMLKLLIFLLKWKSENDFADALGLSEELLFVFPIINLVSSPSKSVKQAAIDLLSTMEKLLVNLSAATEKELTMRGKFPPISRAGDIIFRLLEHLWCQDQPSLFSSFFLNIGSNDGTDINNLHNVPKTWTSQLREYALWIVERRKSSLPISQSQEIFLAEMPLLLSAIASVLVMHDKLGSSAVDLLAVVSIMDPKLGVPLLLTVLYYNNIFSGKDKDNSFHNMLLKLLGMLPSLASHPLMIPLVVQTILPMLQKDAKPVLYATGTRLLCKAWEINDRVFGSLQGVLHPKSFNQFVSERNICISMAASIQDVCRKNPDRGVDLILSVSACIESQDPTIQALGFQSLSHLCEADVIDFYTAWDVVSKHALDSLGNPHVSHHSCVLLRWGAMDAEAYPEAARNVIQILWDVGNSKHSDRGSLWAKARVSAFEALTQYEVLHIQKSIPDFKKRNMELLISETHPEVLRAMEVFEVKIINYEHITRRRFVKEKRVSASKIEKLLDVFPQAMFASGNISGARKLPGAALFCLPSTTKHMKKGIQKLQALQDVHAEYQNALVEIAASLQLSRNILIALLSLNSWKPFMQRWMRDSVILLDAKAPSTLLDKASNAANGIFKIMRRLAEESIPRSAENIALAVGALCEVLPPSAHAVKSTVSKFLLDWLFQYEHEHRQWSAAISLGLISSCLHVTDQKQKFQNIKALIEVASCSRSTLVKGACGVGLGFSCQDLLTRVEVSDNSSLEKETLKIEVEILGRIVRVLSQMMGKLSPSLSDLLESISVYFPLATDDTDPYLFAESLDENCNDLEEDIWGIAGLVLGLGSSIGAIYRSGAHDLVHKIKAFIISWIPNSNPLIPNSFGGEDLDIVFSVGSCLALPFVVAFCQRVELITDTELDHLVSGLRELISEVLSAKKSSAFRQSLLMASCVGAGSLLACISDEGVHSLEVELVKDLLALFRECYSNPHPPLIPLGGMLGVVNALGAGAGILIHNYPSTTLQTTYGRKESFHVIGPLLSSPVLEAQLTSLIQEMFLVAQNSDDHQLQPYAAWAMSFLRHRLWFRELQNVDVSSSSNAAGSKSVFQNFPHDSVVMELSLWLMHLNYPGTGTFSHVNTVATVIRCLSQAPRLPALDWGAIVRRCMKYEGQVAELSSPNLALVRVILREECLQLSLAHSKRLDPLLSFLDELSDLSRLRTLEINLQSWFLSHLADLIKIFSGSRLEKLFNDVANFFSCLLSNQVCNMEHKRSLRVSCWNGLYHCINETSMDSEVYVPIMEHCMEVLFSSLPILHSTPASKGMELVHSVEWSAAVRCLARARQGWLFNLLQVPEGKLVEGDLDFSEVAKKIQAKARLIKIGSIPLSELGKLKAYLLNTKSDGIWDVLVDVVAALQHVEGSIKRQWLLDSVEISCVTCYPSTALQFLGLLCGSFSKYMPLLVLDPYTVLSDLPVTLSSLLLENSRWGVVAESVVSYLWASTERIYDWERGFDSQTPYPPIDVSESDMAVFLLRVMHRACVSLKAYLPPEKQLKLANLMIP